LASENDSLLGCGTWEARRWRGRGPGRPAVRAGAPPARLPSAAIPAIRPPPARSCARPDRTPRSARPDRDGAMLAPFTHPVQRIAELVTEWRILKRINRARSMAGAIARGMGLTAGPAERTGPRKLRHRTRDLSAGGLCNLPARTSANGLKFFNYFPSLSPGRQGRPGGVACLHGVISALAGPATCDVRTWQ